MAKAPKIKATLLSNTPETGEPGMEEATLVVETGEAGDGSDEDGGVYRVTHRVLSPLKCGGVVWAAGDEVTLDLGEDELALLVVEGLIEALEV